MVVYAVYPAFKSVAADNHVYKSTDGSQSWTCSHGTGTTGTPDIPVNSVIVDPQDNDRAPLVGARTNGGGGRSTGSWTTGFYSESIAGDTASLVIRNHNVTGPEYPPAPYVENIGAIPDIPLEYMTRENLLNGGATFVKQFTDIIVAQIQAAPQ